MCVEFLSDIETTINPIRKSPLWLERYLMNQAVTMTCQISNCDVTETEQLILVLKTLL